MLLRGFVAESAFAFVFTVAADDAPHNINANKKVLNKIKFNQILRFIVVP